jgi:hypothetical protein
LGFGTGIAQRVSKTNRPKVSAYFGLVPKQYQSGETDRNGRISKRGPSLVRTLLVQAAWSAVRHSEWAKNVYERISGKQKTGKKKAAIALARKIAVVAWALLRDETNWDPKVMDRVKILGKKRPTETSKDSAKKSEPIVPTSSKVSAPKEKKLSTTSRPRRQLEGERIFENELPNETPLPFQTTTFFKSWEQWGQPQPLDLSH